MTKNQIQQGLASYLASKGINQTKVKCVISGKSMMLTEYEVRYIQYLVSKGELSRNEVIINGSRICSDGYLDDNIPGIFRASTLLSRELM